VNPDILPPKGLTRGIAIGLVLMAVFTVWWASDTFYGFARPVAVVLTAVGVAAALLFIVQSVRLFRITRRLPASEGAGAAQGGFSKKRGRAFGWIFAAEGTLIGVTVVVLASAGLDRFAVPAIALIVGLHFYPMGWVFQRSIDVWLATWVTLVGIAGLVVIGIDLADAALVWAYVGVGVASATLAYGIYMFRYASVLVKRASRGLTAA